MSREAALADFTGYAEESDKRGLVAFTATDNLFVRDQEGHHSARPTPSLPPPRAFTELSTR